MPTLDDGRNAIDQGNLQQARLIYEAILQENPRSEDAWLGLAEVLTDTEDKRICYENVLKINKQNREAREGLRSLEPQADPLVAALQQKAPPKEEAAYIEEDEPTLVSEPFDDVPSSADGETPTFILVAVGLALSVVVMALGGGLVFYLITNMTGG
ncbi:MAG TPA: tetratricopeptide repeat protein [Anaerolineae bacterium]|nr:tetratricopeptide repeat protein [Anaerolineae bacterium]HXV98199.1 tetratricopeptide repeat protein [Anaerolineae bacterium]